MKRDDDRGAPTGPLEVKPQLMVEQGAGGKTEGTGTSPGDGGAPSPGAAAAATAASLSRATRRASSARLVIAVAGLIIGGGVFLLRFISQHGVGEFVLRAEDCRSGLMLERTTGLRLGGICTSNCADDAACGAKFQCRESHCVPRGTKAFGEECQGPWDCQSYTCLVNEPALGLAGLGLGLGKPEAASELPKPYCSRACSDDNPCPPRYACITTSGTPSCVDQGEGAEAGGEAGGDVSALLELMQRAAAAQRQGAATKPEPSSP